MYFFKYLLYSSQFIELVVGVVFEFDEKLIFFNFFLQLHLSLLLQDFYGLGLTPCWFAVWFVELVGIEVGFDS